MNDLIITTQEKLERIIKKCIGDALSRTNKDKEDSSTEEKMLSVEEASDFVNLAIHTVYAKTRKGEIPHYKVNRKLYFKRSELLLWIECEGNMSVYKSRLTRAKKKGRKS